MQPVFGTGWTRKGFSLLWDVTALSKIVESDQVISMRRFFGLVGQWQDDLPAANGDALVVAGLDASLDALTPDDASQWLEETLRPAILSFQDEYEGDAALIFWLPGGRPRIEVQRATNTYLWLCGQPYRNQQLPLGQALWAGAEADARHIMAGSDPQADLEGRDWIGLHLPRIS
ncbi:hypothetical protein [Prochlorothrix hollandica]|uniref:Uncharacterized protein n=1 Tax=Prochlorothrix hollandica PCC 9006 = CALU 1027 TaxID=317619 RepID=A0A0M2PU40_PROHO|nr:hypothetical protein [Prochlorothrix hollandica]KKJ00051.1 hypothetical protein PROH_09825 [Prochlorothrix hollandica PCC 9006 = CALU 1027]